MFNFDAHFSMPGGVVLPALQEVVNKTGLFFGRADRLQFIGSVIDNSAVDGGNTGYTGHLRPGLLMGKILSGADAGKFKQWDPTATDGSQIIAGILAHPLQINYQGTGVDRLVGGWLCVAGGLRAAGVTIASLTAEGISGVAQEWNVRRQLNRNFQLDDYPQGLPFGVIQARTANYTVTEAECGTIFTNAGAAGAVNFTLPVTPKQGLEYEFYAAAAQNLVITAGTADTMVVYNDAAADSVALQTANEIVGGSFRVIGTGSVWLCIPRLWEAQTPTIVT
jgi:hypothetical protein